MKVMLHLKLAEAHLEMNIDCTGWVLPKFWLTVGSMKVNKGPLVQMVTIIFPML